MPIKVSIHTPSLQPGQRRPPRMARGRGLQKAQVPIERAGRQAVAPRRVAEVDAELFLRRHGEPDVGQPDRRPGSPPGGVDDQVGVEELLDAVIGTPQHPDTGDPPAALRQTDDVAPIGDA